MLRLVSPAKFHQWSLYLKVILGLLFISILFPVSSYSDPRGETLSISWDLRAPYYSIEQKGRSDFLTGMDVDLVRLIAAEAGFRIDFQESDWENTLANIESGELDVALGAFYVEQRASYAWFSEPYRVEKQVLFLDRKAHPDFRPVSLQDFLLQVKDREFRLGIVDGYYYGEQATPLLHSQEYASLISMAPTEGLLLNLFINGEIDGFIADRLVGVAAISRIGKIRHLQEFPLLVFEADVHAMFSRASRDLDDVKAFNQALEVLKSSGQYLTTVRRYTAPVLLSNAVSGNWFYILDIIGTIAFAISGVLIARKENYSLLGAFVLASLPAVGGGVIRDLLINRAPIGILETPLYMFLIIGTVLVGYGINWLLKIARGRFLIIFDISVWIVGMSRYILPRNVFEVFDAIGLATFTMTGVAIASRYGADPLLVWGPILAAITAAGGGILRDVFRADAHNPALKTSFYAEIAVCWGMMLSLFIHFWAMEVSTDTMRMAVIVTVVGAFLTRMGIVVAKVRSPRF